MTGSAIPLDFSETHVIIILILLILIMVGMCTGMIYNLIRKLSEDKEDILASRWVGIDRLSGIKLDRETLLTTDSQPGKILPFAKSTALPFITFILPCMVLWKQV